MTCAQQQLMGWSTQDIPLPVRSRREFVISMKEQGYDERLVQWMASNLVHCPSLDNQLIWMFDVVGADEMYASYRASKYWDLLAAPPEGVTLNILRGGASDRWDNNILEKLDGAITASELHRARVPSSRDMSADKNHFGSMMSHRVHACTLMYILRVVLIATALLVLHQF
jgi:hypothetical protein